MKLRMLAVLVALVGCTQAPVQSPPADAPTPFAQATAAPDKTTWLGEARKVTPGDTVPCGKWLSVVSVAPGQATFRIVEHTPSEAEHPYLVGYECLPSGCPGGESMAWPDGVLGNRVTFLAPQGSTYFVVVAKFVLVGADPLAVPPIPGVWTATRGCDTVEIPPE